MPLIDPHDFDAKIHLDGAWVEGGGETIDVIEPATGGSLGRIGGASPHDVARATQSAVLAQRSWAALSHPERSAVLFRAADLWEKHSEEITGWNTREVGAIGPMAAFAVHVAAAECREAGSLPPTRSVRCWPARSRGCPLRSGSRWASSGSSPPSTCRSSWGSVPSRPLWPSGTQSS